VPKENYSEVEKSVLGGYSPHPPHPPSYGYYCSHMGSDATSLGNCLLSFRKNVLPSS